MGMWLNIALIAVILQHCCCMDIDCNNMFPELPYGELECYQEETESQNKEITSCGVVDTGNTRWRVVNMTSGTLSVEFDLMHQSCKHEVYRLDLYINENVTNAEECNVNTTFQLRHSTRGLKILIGEPQNNKKVSPCGKTAVVTFNYIYSGCYVLEIAPGKFDIFNYSAPVFIETEYKKDLLIDKKPRIISQYTAALQQIDVSVLFRSVEEFEDLHIGLHLNSDIDQTMDRACYVSGREHSCCTYRTYGQFMCKMRNYTLKKPSCHVESDGIKCTIHNITTGFYCVLVEILDDRCEQYTVWNNNSYCTYNSRIIRVDPALPQDPETLTPSSSPAAFNAIMVAVVLAVALVCLCVLVLFCRRRRRQSADTGGSCNVKKVVPPRRPRILLLYSRDCEPFMHMMTTFGQALKEVTMCEVYDCFDPLTAEELSLNTTDWLHKHMSSPDVKIVLVESKCAVLHQMALIQHVKAVYKEPTWLDDLFSCGLRILMEDLKMNAYERVFVVRIHGFTEENDNLCHITPYTRYVVPQNTEKLLSSLYQESALEHVLIVEEDHDSSLQRLQDNVRTLQVFKQQNGDYLNSLFETNKSVCLKE